MPKYTPGREKIAVKEVAKSFIENNLNSAAVARLRGTTPQNESKKIRRKVVQDCIQKMLDDPKFKKIWISQGLMGLNAERSTSAAILVSKGGKVIKADDEGGIMLADHGTRHKYWHDFGEAMRVLKIPSGSNGTKIINIVHAYRVKPGVSAVRK